MSPGSRDLHRPLRPELPLDLGKIHIEHRLRNVRKRIRRARHHLLPPVQMPKERRNVRYAVDRYPLRFRHRRFAYVRFRHENLRLARVDRSQCHSKHAAHAPYLAGERDLPDEALRSHIARRRDHTARLIDRAQNRKLQRGAFLLSIRRSQIHAHLQLRNRKAAIPRARIHPQLRFPHRGVRQPDDLELRQIPLRCAFHRHQKSVDSVQCCAACDR